MKLLEFAGYITNKELHGFNKNHSGYGYMVNQIIEGLAKVESLKIYALTQSNFTEAFTNSGVNYLEKRAVDLFKGISLNTLYNAYLINKKDGGRIGFIRHLIYILTIRHLASYVKNFDIIHIHGLSFYTFELVEYCIKNSLNAVVTLHGINYLNESINISNYQTSLEKHYIKKIVKSDTLKLTVISSGIKKRIVDSLKISSTDIKVIPNFTSMQFVEMNQELDIRRKYRIPSGARIILSVGNISRNKNQKHLADVFETLSKNHDNLYLMFLGSDPNNQLKNYCSKLGSADKLRVCGSVDYKLMPNYYDEADILAVTSISEGFGLPIIEAALFGVPCVCYSDLDAVMDIYNGNNMILVDKRDEKCFKNGIETGLERKWNKNKIQAKVEDFTPNSVCNKYFKTFKNLLND